MGAITRALANNIGANGILSASAFSNTKSFGNITALPSGISAGNLKLLSTTTISTNTTNVAQATVARVAPATGAQATNSYRTPPPVSTRSRSCKPSKRNNT